MAVIVAEQVWQARQYACLYETSNVICVVGELGQGEGEGHDKHLIACQDGGGQARNHITNDAAACDEPAYTVTAQMPEAVAAT